MMERLSLLVKPQIDEWGDITYVPTDLGLYITVVVIFLLVYSSILFSRGYCKSRVTQLSVSSVMLSGAFLVSHIRVFTLPMGGSVTLCGMFFITLLGIWYGPAAGIMISTAYGLLFFLLNPYMVSFPQAFVDYVLAFAALGISGFFARSNSHAILKGYLAAVLGRYFFAVLSGVLFFGQYAESYGWNSPLLYSLVYNGTYLGAEALLTIVLFCIPAVRSAIEKAENLALN